MSVYADLQKSKYLKVLSWVLSTVLIGKGGIFTNQSLVKEKRKACEC